MEDAAIYKVQLDGQVVGKFGSAGKLPKQFGLANSIDCRNENELLVGEMTNWRVQKVTLRARPLRHCRARSTSGPTSSAPGATWGSAASSGASTALPTATRCR